MTAMAIPSTDPVTFEFTPDRIQALQAHLARFPAIIRGRGETYAEEGRVGPLALESDEFTAVVQGGHRYTTTWLWSPQGWNDECTCPMGGDCKHSYALGLRFLSTIGARASTGDATTAEATKAESADALESLRRSRRPWDRGRALRGLLDERPGTTVHVHIPPFDAILEETDPDLLCWRLAQALPTATGGWLPTALKPYLEREDLRERMVERKRDQVAARLAAWTARPAAEDARSVRFVVDLRRGTGDTIAVVIEGRATTPRRHDERRTPAQLEQIAREAERKPGLLPDELVDLIEAYTSSLDWNDADGRRATPTTVRRLLEVGGGTPSVTWSEQLDPELARRFDLVPGAPSSSHPRRSRSCPPSSSATGAGHSTSKPAGPTGAIAPCGTRSSCGPRGTATGSAPAS